MTNRREFLSLIAAALAATVLPKVSRAIRTERPRVLSIDAVVATLGLYEALFSHFGYRSSTASSGESALQTLQETTPDLVTLSVALPGIDGFVTLDRIKQAMPWVPVIMISGYRSPYAIAKARRLGAAEYIPKPFDVDDLERLARAYLGPTPNPCADRPSSPV